VQQSLPTAREAAIKFYLNREAFDIEKQLYLSTVVQARMPATLAVESNDDGRWRMPTGYRFPPFVIIERGQSMDEWAHKNKPDFITIMQVRAQLAPTPAAHACRHCACMHCMPLPAFSATLRRALCVAGVALMHCIHALRRCAHCFAGAVQPAGAPHTPRMHAGAQSCSQRT
jgi:hypothetical protein